MERKLKEIERLWNDNKVKLKEYGEKWNDLGDTWEVKLK